MLCSVIDTSEVVTRSSFGTMSTLGEEDRKFGEARLKSGREFHTIFVFAVEWDSISEADRHLKHLTSIFSKESCHSWKSWKD